MENVKHPEVVFSPPFQRPNTPLWGTRPIDLREATQESLIGESAASKRLTLQVRRMGPHFRSVLVLGERGSGKEQVARALHQSAARNQERFVHCDLFALEKAARHGDDGVGGRLHQLFEGSAGGSLFVDRIEELSLPAQALLLRLMEGWERERREHSDHRAANRVIASSHADLRALAAEGSFRQDLYERIAAVQIRVAPLRERVEDILPLARHFLAAFAGSFDQPARDLADDAIERLLQYAWPGNVRELENSIRGAVLECDGELIRERHLPAPSETEQVPPMPKPNSGVVRLQDVVDEHVVRILRQCTGNKLRAAEMLGVSRSTLYRMLSVASVAGRLGEF